MAWKSPSTVNMTKGMSEIIPYLNEVTVNWFGRMLMLSIFMIILIGYSKAKDDWKGGLAISGYVTFILGLLGWVIGFISGFDLGLIIAVSVLGTLILLLDER